ncbi:MAG: hypothetical protein ACYC0X_12460 [Pirellulaceae bacterium]
MGIDKPKVITLHNHNNAKRREWWTMPRRLIKLAIGLLMGATIGAVVGLLFIEELDAKILLAFIGAFFGGVLGGNVIRTVGWCMIAGALVGGITAIMITRIGKAAMYGVPIGTILGMIVGLVVEKARSTGTE